MKTTNRRILAYDLDGTLCKEVCWTPKECLNATPIKKVVDSINSHYEDSITIVYTARKDSLISASITWLQKNGIKYWAISNQKLHADLYVDDNAINTRDL